MSRTERVLVVGATGGTGRAVVSELLESGHSVTAFSRSAGKLAGLHDRLSTEEGDVLNPGDLDRVVPGHDVVIITLGIAENPLRVRLFGTRGTPLDVRSAGTRAVVAAMRRHAVPRLVVLSSFGVGETRGRLRFVDRLVFSLLLAPQIADTEAQEKVVRESGLEWVLAQPVHLTDDASQAPPFASTAGEVSRWKVSRGSVAHFLAEAVRSTELLGRSVTLSGRGAA